MSKLRTEGETRAEGGGRGAEGGGWRAEGGGRRAEGVGSRAEGIGRKWTGGDEKGMEGHTHCHHRSSDGACDLRREGARVAGRGVEEISRGSGVASDVD